MDGRGAAISRGYGFMAFSEEGDMHHRAHSLGQSQGQPAGGGLHGMLRLNDASAPASMERERGGSRSRDSWDGRARYASSDGTNQSGYLSPVYPVPFAPLSPSPTQSYHSSPSGPLSPTLRSPLSSPPLSANGPGHWRSDSASPMLSPSLLHAHAAQLASSSTSSSHSHLPHPPPPSSQQSHVSDSTNTTVFVGGLPACISEETLKSFFHHFGEITYCKIPTGKGCGFVQFVRRADAELAIAKMNDFPIHGKSRIRLSWGRSQGDKQVERVRKLASALGVQFDAVWRMVQGQENPSIKQINPGLGGGSAQGPMSPLMGMDALPVNVGRMELSAVANAAGLTEAEVMDLVGGSRNGSEGFGGLDRSTNVHYSSSGHANGGGSLGESLSRNPLSMSIGGASGGGLGRFEGQPQDFYPRSSIASPSLGLNSTTSPYSRVNPSTFSAFSTAGQSPSLPPLSPSASTSGFRPHHHLQQQHHPMLQHPTPNYAPSSPYTSIRPESYLVHSPTSPYERVAFAEGGVPPGARGLRPVIEDPRYHRPQQAYQPYAAVQPTTFLSSTSAYAHEQPHSMLLPHQQLSRQQNPLYQSQGSSFAGLGTAGERSSYARTDLEESFGNLSFTQSTNSATPQPPPTSDFYVPPPTSSTSTSTTAFSPAASSDLSQSRIGFGRATPGPAFGNESQWGPWSLPRDVQA